MSTLYDLLGVDKGADADTLKKAFRRKALTEHPDKGGDNDRFRKINEAYNVLSDSQKRAYYDQTGEIPTDGPVAGPTSGGGMPNFADIFGSMFGGGGFPMPMFHGMGGGPPQKAQRGPNKLHEIGVTLADMYAGRTIKLHMKRDCLCGECGGKGGNIMESCAACRGRGVRMLHQQMGPMITVSQQPCEACRATGQRATDKCRGCAGRRVVEREASLDVVIEPGMQEGDRIVFPGQCSESPDFESPGDVILVVRSASTDTDAWERRGADLIVKVELTLAESLLGWSRSLSGHPSGLSVPLVWRGGVVRDGEVLRVPGWGMPRRSAASAATEGKGELRLLCRVSEGQGQGQGQGQGAWSEEQQRALKSVWPDWVEPVEEEGSVKPERPQGTQA